MSRITFTKSWVAPALSAFTFVFLSLLSACGNGPGDQLTDEPEDMNKEQIVEVVTNVMDFVMDDTIPSGWVTFKYHNKSENPHFFIIDDYPDGKTKDTVIQRVIIPFQAGMTKIMEGKGEEAGAEFAKLPSWYADVKFRGGSGIISPGGISMTTLKLEPGNYFLECYMKMEGGVFHSSAGMLQPFVVADQKNSQSEPHVDAKVHVSISGDAGIVIREAEVPAGTTTFEVVYKDQKVHENFVGHDVHLARLDDAADIRELEEWMNWANPKGLLLQPPTGVTFLGGVNETPFDSIGYFTAVLEPGVKYVLVSEVPNTIEKKLMQEFTPMAN